MKVENMTNLFQSSRYLSQVIMENEQLKIRGEEEKKVAEKLERVDAKRQKLLESNALIPSVWTMEDLFEKEKHTIQLNQLNSEREYVKRVDADIKKTNDEITKLNKKYTLVESKPEDSESKRKRIDRSNSKVPLQWSSEDIATLQQLHATLSNSIQERENASVVSPFHRGRTIMRRKNDLKRLENKYIPVPTEPGKNKESEDIKIELPLRTKRIKVTVKKGCESSLETVDKWIGTVRWIYNQCVAFGRDYPEKLKQNSALLNRDLEDNILELRKSNHWVEECPGNIRQDPVREYISCLKRNQRKVVDDAKKGKPFSFKMGFRRKSEAINESFTVGTRDWGCGAQAFLVTDFTSKEMESLPTTIPHAVTITKTRIGLYFNFSSGRETDTSTYRPHDIVALDPGVRTFMTGYYSDGVVIEWGAGDMSRIFSLLRFADKLHSKMDKLKGEISDYKDELTKENPDVNERATEIARLVSVKARLTKTLMETNVTIRGYKVELETKKKELTTTVKRFGKDHHLVKKLKKEIQKLEYNVKQVVGSDPDIVKAHNDVTRSKGEIGKLKNELVGVNAWVISRKKKLSGYNRAYLRMLLRLRYKIDEAHKKFATYLCRNVRVVLLPKFETSRMVKNVDRNISGVTTRKMLTWGHYRFREMLINKAALSSSCQVIICDEHYTSKTCGGCGKLHNDLGTNKTFTCPHCPYTSDRDINAARNILLRYLTLNCIQFERGIRAFAPTAYQSVPLGENGREYVSRIANKM